MRENVQFPVRWTVDTMTALLDDTAAAKGNAASLTAKISAMDTAIAGKLDSIPIADADTLGGVKIGSGISIASDGTISVSGSGGATDYTDLTNKPQINSVTLSGNKSLSDIGAASASDLAKKQDTISDLSTIRSGASAGATAVQTIKINGTAQTKTSGVVNLPAYPTTLPASDTVDTYSASSSYPISGKGVAAAIGTLDAASVGGTGKYISAISETNGIISASVETMDTSLTSGSTKAITSGAVYTVQQTQNSAIATLSNTNVKNLFNFDAWKSVGINNGTSSISGNAITVTATAANCYTSYNLPTTGSYPAEAIIPVSEGDKIVFTWDYTPGGSQTNDKAYLFRNGSAASGNFKSVSASTGILEDTIPSGVSYVTIRFDIPTSGNSATFSNIMVCKKELYTISSVYQPYAPSNRELYEMILALQ